MSVRSHNHISSISKNALEQLSKLSILELNYNDLKEIGPNDFPKLLNLKELKINRNKLASFAGFKQLNSLLHLYVCWCINFIVEPLFKLRIVQKTTFEAKSKKL